MLDFGRLVTAMVTPFNQDQEIDLKETKKLVDHLIATGTEAIVVAGTTGESPTLTKDEKLLLFEKVLEFANGRAKVIAGTGTNNTKTSIELTKAAEQIGVDGVMLVAPYYNKPSQEGLYNHFKAIAAETKLPIMIYNIPGRTGVNIQAKTLIELSKIDNIVSVKEASGDLTQMGEIIKNTADDFYLYSGDDKLTLPVLSIGGYGIVSVASHLVGDQMKDMINSYLKGNNSLAASIHLDLLEFFEAIFVAPNPAPIKYLLNNNGFNVGSVRLPLVTVTDEQSNYLNQVYQKIMDRN
ncbi:4-hydroxy-tetrahydrodipicolinate synthase [Vulcanibacillus modesticaldus]|uniref:4-hydroxy-tetrahydrodipicolinate synthase n=1 Tax=Vulcanibacillus modesticaldus TaxID=337097 RepID=A0A1D2YXT1_9BACI|nr:4-hydroxy-tetrahydrodipicolinate synthase [Vulcanibacillus modesticaldus]OEG00493.1 4-hydroxy-tetrahydrodipicolinate synthase [Vulcanibacillus modesticaldus]